MTGKTYDYKALIEVYMNTKGYETYTDEWKAYYVEYYVRLFKVLLEFFDIHLSILDFMPPYNPDDKRFAALALFQHTVSDFIRCFRPTRVGLAAPSGFTELSQTYHEKINAVRQELHDAYWDCLYGLFTFMYGEVDTVVTSEMLKEKGFDDSIVPDHMKYFMEEYDRSVCWWMDDNQTSE